MPGRFSPASASRSIRPAEMHSSISQRSPAGATRISNLIRTSVEKLPSYPHLHREGREPGTREAVVHPNYIYIYVVRKDAIHILRVLHARQHYP